MSFAPDEQRAFRRENRWNVTSVLMGCTMGAWFSILRERAADVAWLTYGHRVVVLTLSAAFHSAVSVVESLVYGRTVAAQPVRDDPVFVLGHPRTGTTLVYNLLGMDTASFIYPTTYLTTFPFTALALRPVKGLVSRALPKTRPMDNMELGLDMPQEDELGTNALSGGVSLVMPIVFMTRALDYFPYFTFERAPAGKFDAWRRALHLLLRKAAVLAGGQGPRRMLLKSPMHTARVRLLDGMFARASYIYIFRHPFAVFQSAANMAEKTYSLTYLDDPTDAQIQEFILAQFELLLDEYLAARERVRDRLLEIRYEAFEADPFAGVCSIYAHFGWPMPMRDELRAHCAQLRASYAKNDFRELTPGLKALIYRRWRRAFDVFGYEP
ncbi:hypothetical protein KFE25_007717 [Diacronema lutheri]|uniref:Uncharacterized protein n=1 Tax=Diacronema lutheri TaxID=2081491 RepID=A0A8J5XRM6_DIALT|nr:hypothetical protein KFE25_007717 [Diacronema lutheri]